MCEKYFHDVPFEANFASDIPQLHPMTAMPGVDGFTMKVDALYKVGPHKLLSCLQGVWIQDPQRGPEAVSSSVC